MGKVFKPLMAIVTGTALVASVVACCCMGQFASAQGLAFQKTSAHACCHGDPTSRETNAKSCQCHVLKGDLTEAPLASAGTSFFAYDAHFLGALMALKPSFSSVFAKIAHGGAPPGEARSVPLYLHHHVFRL